MRPSRGIFGGFVAHHDPEELAQHRPSSTTASGRTERSASSSVVRNTTVGPLLRPETRAGLESVA
jgi:hypothetical protein